jgi:ABC-type branched-subunit amino acid transport system permease subunit
VFFSISWLTSSVVAGITALAGPIVGALFFGLYPELTKSAVQAASISFMPEIVAASLLLLIMAVNPGGLASMGRFVRSRATAHADPVARGDDDLEALERAVEAAEDAA